MQKIRRLKKQKPVALFACSPVKFGGWVSYTVHLFSALKDQGYEPRLFRITKKSEARPRPYADGISYRNISLADAWSTCKKWNRAIVTYAAWKDCKDVLPALLDAGAGIVLHDPTEFHKDLLSSIGKSKVVVIRPANKEALSTIGIESSFIPHPYVPPLEVPKLNVSMHAVSYSRVDFDKGTHLICEANKNLATEKRCTIYGALNRIYAFHKLDKEYDWRKEYMGKFPAGPGNEVALAESSDLVVDMSTIKGDGGGTQYTFLEAWQSGTPLIVNRGWLMQSDRTMEHRRNCYAVENATELRLALSEGLDPWLLKQISQGGKDSLLETHSPKPIASAFREAMGWE